MTDRSQSRSHDEHDRTYEPPAVSPLGTVEQFTQGDQLTSLDEPA